MSASEPLFPSRQTSLQNLAASMPHALWCGDAQGARTPQGVGTGYPMLDGALPGRGWPPAMLTELLWPQAGVGELRLLAPALRAVTRGGKALVMLAPPYALCAPALAQCGLDVRQLLLVQADRLADRLWAIEQVLKSGSAGALLAWLPQARAEHLRRLQLAAASADSLAFLCRPLAARHESSPAPLRLACRPRRDGCLEVDVFKRRGPATAAPVILPPAFPEIILRALAVPRQDAPVVPLAEPGHALDRAHPAAAAARPGVSTLA